MIIGDCVKVLDFNLKIVFAPVFDCVNPIAEKRGSKVN